MPPLHHLGGALLIGVLVSACAAPVAPAGSTSTSTQPVAGGTFYYPAPSEPALWDPQLSEGKATQEIGLLFPRLVQYKTGPGVDPNSFIVAPDLAERWDQPDDRTYIFRLRTNGRWGREAPLNGRAIVADDVVFSFTRLASEKSAFRGNWTAVESIQAVDPATVKFTLKYPFAPFLAYAAYHASRLIPPEIIQQCGDLRTSECAAKVGGGPWLLEKYEPGVQIVFKKNPDYYDAPRPYLDRIVRPILTDAASREAAFIANKLYAGIAVSPARYESMKREIPELQWAQQGGAQQQLVFNVSAAPWNNVKVRQAVSMAINRQAYINSYLQGSGRLEQPSRNWFSDSGLSQDELKRLYAEDVTRAKALLAEAGYPNGFDGGKLLAYRPAGTNVPSEDAPILVDQLKRNLNISLQIDSPEVAVGQDRFFKGDFTLAYGVYARSYPDPDDYLFARYATTGSRNYGKCSDAKLDSLIDAQRRQTDPAKRSAAIGEIDRYFITDVVCALILPSSSDYWPYWPNVRGFVPHISFGLPELAGTWLAN